jgi:hypothetical protein
MGLTLMHPFAINLSERHRVPFYIAAAAFGIAWLVSVLSSSADWRPPYWLEVPGTVSLYALGYWVFKEWLWRIPVVRQILHIKTPHLSGQWSGVVKTSFDAHGTEHQVDVSIQQSWTEISIRLRSASSSSESISASFVVDAGNSSLAYEYANSPRPGAASTMHAHRGTTRLSIEGDTLNGEYYSGRDRANQGVLTLSRRL